MMTARRKPRRRVTDQEFIAVWESAPTGTDAAKTLGMSQSNASERASRLRANGVPLKIMDGGRPPKDFKALAAYTRSLRSRTPPSSPPRRAKDSASG